VKGKFAGRCASIDGRMLRPRKGGAADSVLRLACDRPVIRRGSAHDAAMLGAQDAEGKAEKVAEFPAAYTGNCACSLSEGKMSADDCDGLMVFDDDGNQVATFKGKNYGMGRNDAGLLTVYRVAAPAAATSDAAFARNREPDARIAALNKRNAEFWRRFEE
jgi:hypothetical protein